MNTLILHIHTTASKGFVALAQNEQIIASIANDNPLNHASFLQPAIQGLLCQHGISGRQLSAICIANGPGSYTGIRVGLATAKGLCFAWQKPLVALNSLKIMAKAVQIALNKLSVTLPNNTLIVPMIDARRLEVFYGIYQFLGLVEVDKPTATILTADFLIESLRLGPVYFSGDGVNKWKSICYHSNAHFFDLPELVNAMAQLGLEAHDLRQFSSLAYLEPEYVKPYFSNL